MPKPGEVAAAGQHQRPYRIAFVVIALVLGGLAITLPFALRSVLEDVAEPAEGAIFTIPIGTAAPVGTTQSRLHVSFVELDEARLLATLRVSGHQVCQPACSGAERVLFFSFGTNEAATAGMPPSARVDLTSTDALVTQSVTLPVRGTPSRYPFDVYELWLGVGMARVLPDGTVQPLSRAEGAGHLLLTLQEQLPRETMSAPVAANPDLDREPDDPYELQTLQVLRFSRPLHEQILAMLLVLLISAAAAYAVFMHPLHQLVLSSGALVIGVWGIRALLSPGTAYRTLVDLALSAVILFLLAAITVRALRYCYQRGGLGQHHPAAGPATGFGNTCDYPGCANTIATRCAVCGRAFCPRHVSATLPAECDLCATDSDPVGTAPRPAPPGAHTGA